MKIKTSELTWAALDWAVAKCEGWKVSVVEFRESQLSSSKFAYSSVWAKGGPIIEREGITVSKEDGCWSAYFRDNLFEDDGSEHWQTGPTPLIAAMRCFVASHLGDEVDIPQELL